MRVTTGIYHERSVCSTPHPHAAISSNCAAASRPRLACCRQALLQNLARVGWTVLKLRPHSVHVHAVAVLRRRQVRLALVVVVDCSIELFPPLVVVCSVACKRARGLALASLMRGRSACGRAELGQAWRECLKRRTALRAARLYAPGSSSLSAAGRCCGLCHWLVSSCRVSGLCVRARCPACLQAGEQKRAFLA